MVFGKIYIKAACISTSLINKNRVLNAVLKIEKYLYIKKNSKLIYTFMCKAII